MYCKVILPKGWVAGTPWVRWPMINKIYGQNLCKRWHNCEEHVAMKALCVFLYYFCHVCWEMEKASKTLQGWPHTPKFMQARDISSDGDGYKVTLIVVKYKLCHWGIISWVRSCHYPNDTTPILRPRPRVVLDSFAMLELETNIFKSNTSSMQMMVTIFTNHVLNTIAQSQT